MLKFVQIIDSKTKAVAISEGTNVAYYQKIGMQQKEVEYCEWNKTWYLKGYAPVEPELSTEEQIEQYKTMLKIIDEKSIRPLREIRLGKDIKKNKEILEEYENQAEQIRLHIELLQNNEEKDNNIVEK